MDLSCWKCEKPFIEGYEFCLSCNANLQAFCMICYNGVYAKRVFDVHCLYNDEGWSGRPICLECYELLKGHPKLDVPIKRKKPKKRGLEIWL